LDTRTQKGKTSNKYSSAFRPIPGLVSSEFPATFRTEMPRALMREASVVGGIRQFMSTSMCGLLWALISRRVRFSPLELKSVASLSVPSESITFCSVRTP
jgi:hypothetical protein